MFLLFSLYFCFTGPRRGARFSIASDAVQIVKMMLGKQEKILQIGNLNTTRAVTDVRDMSQAEELHALVEDAKVTGRAALLIK